MIDAMGDVITCPRCRQCVEEGCVCPCPAQTAGPISGVDAPSSREVNWAHAPLNSAAQIRSQVSE